MAGSNNKEKNVMPVELAIQRELIYRRKVAAFQLRSNTNSIEKVKPSNETSHPMALTCPSSKLFSSPSCSGTKRKEAPTSIVHHPPKHQQSIHDSLNHKTNADDLFCKICQVSCSSAFNLKQHCMGQKHKYKKNLQEGRSNPRHWCEMCRVQCMDAEMLKLHLQGQKHKAKMEKLEINNDEREALSTRKWCELCKLWCIDEFSFKQHLVGKKHIVQLHSLEKEKEKDDYRKRSSILTL